MPQLDTPVTLLIFNRPDLVRQVWAAIRAARPRRLFIVADGPRPAHPADKELCAACRAIVADVDWPCHVERNYAAQNLGCDDCVPRGISWVFDQVDESIILEDDILPDPSFFPFCRTLLDRYRDDHRVMGIGGFNFAGQWRSQARAYHMHRWAITWGWATWRRAWPRFDLAPEVVAAAAAGHSLPMCISDPEQADYRSQTYSYYLTQRSMPWDVQWATACNLAGGLWISPAVNLITNLGFGASATHTTVVDDLRAYVIRGRMPSLDSAPSMHGEHVDDEFDRVLYLLEILNAMRDVRGLRLWQRALERTPSLEIPGMPPIARAFLPPLRRPLELLAVLDTAAPYWEENPRMQRLRSDLAKIAENP